MKNNPTQLWLLKIQADAKILFDEFSDTNKRTTFHQLKQLLESSTPYHLPFVLKLKEMRFEGVRRFRVGDYRVMFVLEIKEIVSQGHLYKGTLHIISITNRKESYQK
jgi:mRNA-degrading endonuclease RelE of RelBE toxin-antitoxin system